MADRKKMKISLDTGMIVVIFISLMYIVLVFGLLFYVKNDWCDLLFKNMTVRFDFIFECPIFYNFRKMLLAAPEAIIRLGWGPWWQKEI